MADNRARTTAVSKYVDSPDLGAGDRIVGYCGIAKVCGRMQGDNAKSRVAFHYLLAEETGTLGKLR